MNIEDEEVEREDFQPKVVGRGLRAQFENPEDEQWYLADSEHPYAPFPGNALKWESFVYDDGTSFEGLVRENIPHGKGVMVFGTGTGAGINVVEPGDKYEGEFFAGFANGLGAFTGTKGDVYRGEWRYGKRHGCGALTNFAPFFRELRKGSPPEEAWKRTKSVILSKRMRYGQWERNRFVKDARDDDKACSVAEVRGILQEMESVITKARMFQYKPDGDASHIYLREKQGVPVPVFQDPLHYPHGTKFLAPGPLGQCHPVPENQSLRSELKKHARNYMRIYTQFNLPYLARPGDDLFAATRLHQAQQLQKQHFRRLAAGEEETDILSDMAAQISRTQRQQPSKAKAAGKEDQSRHRAKPPAPTRRLEEQDIDESDLVATANGLPATIFCSVTSSQSLPKLASETIKRGARGLISRVCRQKSLSQVRTRNT